jgi:N-methylhydantoinase A
MSVRIGVDVGGTFTDVCLFDHQSQEIRVTKVPSVPVAPERAILHGVERILMEGGYQPGDVEFLVHGTTIATNAIIEGKGARVGLLVTEGFRDVLQIVRQDRPKLYDYFAQRATPLVPRQHTYEVRERMLFTGDAKLAVDEPATRALLQRIRAAGEIDILSVSLLHSYANPGHEQRVRELILEEIPGMKASLSCDVLPEIKEYERTITTVANAYVLPVVSGYLSRLQEKLRETNLRSDLFIMQSNGGVMTADTAMEKSVHTILSGPAAGALAARWLGQMAGFERLVTIDMGGTSADVSLIDSKLVYAQESVVAGHVIKVPTIDINSVGAGGGSIAFVDQGGALQVGPVSAGALPGPACYGRGGNQATVTDANLVLGRLNPDYFLGGEMRLDVEAARRAVYDNVARPLALELEQAAEGIIRVVNATMVRGIRRMSVERGHDPRAFTLFAFGGGGPVHGALIADELNILRTLIPASAGVGSALGCIVADFRHDYVQTVLGQFLQFSSQQLEQRFVALEQKALDQMRAEGLSSDRVTLLRGLDMRYVGQGYELEVSVPQGPMTIDRMRSIDEQYRTLHKKMYGYESSDPTELVTIRLMAVGDVPPVAIPSGQSGGEDASHALKAPRDVFFDGAYRLTAIYDGYRLECGNRVTGPSIIERTDSTVVVPPRMFATKDPFGNVLITSNGVI